MVLAFEVCSCILPGIKRDKRKRELVVRNWHSKIQIFSSLTMTFSQLFYEMRDRLDWTTRYKYGAASPFSSSFWKTRNMDAKWLISVRPVAPDHTLYFHWRCVRVSCFVALLLLRFQGGIWHFWRKDLFRPTHIYCVELRVSQTRVCCCTNQRLCMMDVKGPLFRVDISNITPRYYIDTRRLLPRPFS